MLPLYRQKKGQSSHNRGLPSTFPSSESSKSGGTTSSSSSLSSSCSSSTSDSSSTFFENSTATANSLQVSLLQVEDADSNEKHHQQQRRSNDWRRSLQVVLLTKRRAFLSLFLAVTLLVVLLVVCTSNSSRYLLVLQKQKQKQQQKQTCPISEWKYPQCAKYLDSGVIPPPYTQEKWIEMRKAYVQVVGEHGHTLADDWKLLPQQQQDGQSLLSSGSFHVPIEIRTSPGKGRGMFAKTDIPKGTMVWSNRYTARFNECQVRQFFDLISEEDACNTIMWAYLNNFYTDDNDGSYEMSLDMDECVYVNQAPSPQDRNLENRFVMEDTVASETERPDKRQRRIPGNYGMFAERDIPAGSELLIDYGQIHKFAAAYWYEKMNFQSRGLWHYVTMY